MSKLVVLISGRGSNCQAIVAASRSGYLNAEVAAIISNRADAGGLKIGAEHDIPTHVITPKQSTREQFDRALIKCIELYSPDWIVLAGFMRILGADFVQRFEGRILNIHPSLLPRYPGLDTHARALNAKDSVHGASVHFVTEELDGGPVIGQVRVPVLEGDSVETLSERVLAQEHSLYVETLRICINAKLSVENNRCYANDKEVILPLLTLHSEGSD